MIRSADTKLQFYKWSLISNSWHCLLPPVELCTLHSPGARDTLTSYLPVTRWLRHDDVTRSRAQWSRGHLACHNLYQMTPGTLLALRMMQLRSIRFLKHPDVIIWMWRVTQLFDNHQQYLDNYQSPCSIVWWIKHMWVRSVWVEIQLGWWEISLAVSPYLVFPGSE